MSRWIVGITLSFVCAASAARAETLPPAPARHFNDAAGVVRAETAARLDERLEAFERETSTQILVAIYPAMDSESSIEDYTVRVAESWKVGQAEKNNGAVLFAFMAERALYLQVGYGLEGALPDATAKRIISDEILPRFRAGDFDGGFTAGVGAILAAAKGEYRAGSEEGNRPPASAAPVLFAAFAFALIVIVLAVHNRRALAGGGRHWTGGSGGWTSSHGGGFFSGGGGGFSSGGGFSGGGGHFGGGGAGGRW